MLIGRFGARAWAERATVGLRATGHASARLMAMELPEGERDPAVLADALS